MAIHRGKGANIANLYHTKSGHLILVRAPESHNSALLSFGDGGLGVAKVPGCVLDRIRERPQDFPLPLEPMHGWRSAPDEGGHTHCESCCATIYPGDPVVGCYLEYVSVVFCPACVADNPELFRVWLAPQPY